MAFVRSGPATNAAALLTMDLNVTLDVRVLGFTAALRVLSALLCGGAAALRGSSVTLAPALMGRGADSSRGAHGRFALGKALVVLQVALALVLVGGALLLGRTLTNLTSEDLGFDRERVLLVWSLPGQTGGRGAAAANFWHDAIARVAAMPGVSSVSASNQGVLTGSDFSTLGSGTGLRIEGEPTLPKGLGGLRSFVAPDFFKTMGIPILIGRDFTEADSESAPRGVVISQAMARHYFGDRNPVGHRKHGGMDKYRSMEGWIGLSIYRSMADGFGPIRLAGRRASWRRALSPRLRAGRRPPSGCRRMTRATALPSSRQERC